MIHQYSLPESVGLVKDILKKLHRFIDEVPSKRQHGVFTPLLPAIVLLCQTFPPLSVEAIDFLLHLCRVCLINNSPGSNGNSNMGCPLSGAKWAFDEISKTVLMKVSCKT